jgi:hypothetical protein
VIKIFSPDLTGLGLIVLDFPYISEKLTDKSNTANRFLAILEWIDPY